MVKSRKKKPSEYAEEDLELKVTQIVATISAEAQEMLDEMVARNRIQVKRKWVRSPRTDAIVNSGPNWKPGQPFTDYMRLERKKRNKELRNI